MSRILNETDIAEIFGSSRCHIASPTISNRLLGDAVAIIRGLLLLVVGGEAKVRVASAIAYGAKTRTTSTQPGRSSEAFRQGVHGTRPDRYLRGHRRPGRSIGCRFLDGSARGDSAQYTRQRLAEDGVRRAESPGRRTPTSPISPSIRGRPGALLELPSYFAATSSRYQRSNVSGVTIVEISRSRRRPRSFAVRASRRLCASVNRRRFPPSCSRRTRSLGSYASSSWRCSINSCW